MGWSFTFLSQDTRAYSPRLSNNYITGLSGCLRVNLTCTSECSCKLCLNLHTIAKNNTTATPTKYGYVCFYLRTHLNNRRLCYLYTYLYRYLPHANGVICIWLLLESFVLKCFAWCATSCWYSLHFYMFRFCSNSWLSCGNYCQQRSSVFWISTERNALYTALLSTPNSPAIFAKYYRWVSKQYDCACVQCICFQVI